MVNVMKKNRLVGMGAVLAVLMLVVSMLLPTYAYADDDNTDLTFYRVASATSMYYDDAKSNEKSSLKEGVDGDTALNMGNAAAFLGFEDPDYGKGWFGSAASWLSASAQAHHYSAYAGGADGSTDQALYHYMLYGHALSMMGVDSTSNEHAPMEGIARFIGGGLMWLAFHVTMFAENIFGGLLEVLKFFNPFQFLSASATMPSYARAAMPSTPSGIFGFVMSWMAPLRDVISRIYDLSYVLGWVLVPVFLALFVVSITLLRNSGGSSMGKFKKFAIRVGFLVLGIPLLGITYTGALDMVGSLTAGSHSNANYVIASTYVDFEAWAKYGHLKLPTGTQIVVDIEASDGGAIDPTSTNVRMLARSINAQYANKGAGWLAQYVMAVMAQAGLDSNWNTTALGTSSTVSGISINTAGDILQRYIGDAYYHAADFETSWRGSLSETELQSLNKAIDESLGDYGKYKDSGLVKMETDSGVPNWLTDGGVGPGPSSDNKVTFSGGMGRISTLGMYNYLTTSFDDSSVVTYSPTKATSALVRQSHHSVNVVGTGFTKILYWANALSMLMCISVMAIGYAFAMLINNIRRGIKTFVMIPMSMMGSLKAMARITTTILMMVVEVVMTLFIYSISVELYVGLNAVLEAPFVTWLNIPALGAASYMSGVAQIVMLLVTIIFNIWFLIQSIKWRKSLVRAVDEGMASVIDRFFSSGNEQSNAARGAVASDRGSGALGKAAGVVGTGAGLALGARAADKAAGRLLGAAGAGNVVNANTNNTDGGDDVKVEGDGSDPNAPGDGGSNDGGSTNGGQVIENGSGQVAADGVSSEQSGNSATQPQMARATADKLMESGSLGGDMSKPDGSSNVSETKKAAVADVATTAATAANPAAGAALKGAQAASKGVKQAKSVVDTANRVRQASASGAPSGHDSGSGDSNIQQNNMSQSHGGDVYGGDSHTQVNKSEQPSTPPQVAPRKSLDGVSRSSTPTQSSTDRQPRTPRIHVASPYTNREASSKKLPNRGDDDVDLQ